MAAGRTQALAENMSAAACIVLLDDAISVAVTINFTKMKLYVSF